MSPQAMRGVTLRRRLGLALTAGALALLVLGGTAVWALAVVDDRESLVTEAYFAAIAEADAGYIALLDAESAVRGYAQTGDPVSLEPVNRMLDGVPGGRADAGARLEEHLGPHHVAVQARERAAAAAGRWYTEFARPAIETTEAQGRGSVGADELTRGTALFEPVRSAAEAYIALLTDGRQAAMDDLHWSGVLLRLAMASLVVAAVVVGVLLWVFLRRWVTDPLVELAADARTVAGGDVDHVVRASGPGEVGQMAADVELMRRRLAELIAEHAAVRAALEQSHTTLEERAEDLRRSNRDLEQFAYVASHDLQEPLRKVASFTQLLARRYEGQLDERADQYIGFAVDGAKRMQRLINDLLGFSRVGRIGGELTDVDLGEVLVEAKEVLAEVIEAAGATVTGQDLPVVRGEAPLLVQLTVNLLGNALKFRHPERAPVVRLDARRVGDFWELSCSDNGIGIDPQYADRVFVIFQRLHAKEVYEGTGIGLALCKKIVEFHGGDIWVARDVSQGTTIRWTLPADAQTVTADRLEERAG